MHLINARTYELEYFVGAGIPKYAILSHVWGKEEVLFHDLSKLKSARKREGFMKIRHTCEQALRDGLHYAWVDTCCINKESSADLSEAINSMFKWYSRAAKCYAYLSDLEVVQRAGIGSQTQPPFANSRWFTRGWTLQELIAPPDVLFMDRNWALIGSKRGELLGEINRITGIDKAVLMFSDSMFRMTIAKRMSWAAKRQTTRKEDESYCLLGLFDVSIPMLYGEEEGAFVRLQEELIRKTTDQSVFAHHSKDGSLLARSPRDFDGFADVMPCIGILADKSYELTNAGLLITLPVLTKVNYLVQAVLNCHRNHRRLVLSLQKRPGRNGKALDVMANVSIKETEIVTLLQCPEEELLIARDRTFLVDPVSEDPLLGRLNIARLWLNTAKEAESLEITIETLEPVELWDIATPVEEQLTSCFRSSERRAYFDLYSSPDGTSIAGTITFRVSDDTSEPTSLRIHFQPQEGSILNLSQDFSYELDLYDTRQPCTDGATSSAPEDRKSIKCHCREAGSKMEVTLTIKELRVTVALEGIPGYYGAFGMVGPNHILHLRVNKVDRAHRPSEGSR